MTTKVAINGLGRIGSATLKIILETPELELVALNDLLPVENLAYLLTYDSVYGRYEKEVVADKDGLHIDGKLYRMFNEKDPAQLPWEELDIDIVFECTGVFRKKQDLEKHLEAGAKRVFLSAPEKTGEVKRDVTVEEVNEIFQEESQTDRYRGILGVARDPIVFSDIIKDPRASIVDPSMTQVVDGDLLKVMSWYDNEWGYACQMVREAAKSLNEFEGDK